MKMTFENLSKKGTVIIVESATKDGGKTNNPKGWWGARIYKPEKNNVPSTTFTKLLNECTYRIIGGGYKNGKLISTITKIKITHKNNIKNFTK